MTTPEARLDSNARFCVSTCILVLMPLVLIPAASRAAPDGNDLCVETQDSAFPGQKEGLASLLDTVKHDYENFYFSPDRWIHLGLAFGAGAIMANTDIDGEIQDWYQQRIRSGTTNRVSDVARILGTGQYVVPVCLGAALLGDKLWPDDGDSPLATWGVRATRAYVTGLPALFAAQWLTGASRPYEGDSHWQPFHDYHGVSGHTFIGAVPFLTAARMCEDDPLARYLLYAASILPGLSRINDNQHYPSQVLLGWFLAWEATRSIAHAGHRGSHVSLEPIAIGNGYGLSLCIRW